MKIPNGWEEAQKALRANMTPRHKRLDLYERYVEGTQYEGLASWYNDNVPLLERAPNIVEPVAAKAIVSFVSLCLGETRWPGITIAPSQEDVFDEALRVGDDAAEIIDRGLSHISHQSQLETVARTALSQAMGCGTAVAIASVKDGSLCIETPKAKWCLPTFNETQPKIVDELEIRYCYLREYKDTITGRWCVEALLYRRKICKEFDVTYKPAKASEDGAEPDAWIPEVEIRHGLGFCPVVWYPFETTYQTAGKIDGHPIHERLLDEIDALNRSLSQHDRASLYVGDPQPIEIGVDEDYNPAPTGRIAEPMRHYAGESPYIRGQNEKWSMGGTTASSVVRRKGPGVVWRYPSKDSKVSFLSLPSGALESIQKNIYDLREQLSEALSWVRVDPGTLRGSSAGAFNISGRALQWMYRRQTDRCDMIRPDFEQGFVLPILNVLLRICLALAKRGDRGLYLAGINELAAALVQFEQPIADAEGDSLRWFMPPIEVNWGLYFENTATDWAQIGEQTREDLGSGIIDKQTAVRQMAPFYDIQNPHEYAEQMAEHEHAHAASLQGAIEALNEATPEDEDEES